MSRKVRVKRYTRTAMFLHWAAALGIFTLFLHGFYISRLPADVKAEVLGLHRSIGVALLLLVLVRIALASHACAAAAAAHVDRAGILRAFRPHLALHTDRRERNIRRAGVAIQRGRDRVLRGRPAHRGRLQRGRGPGSHIVGYTTARALGISVALHVLAALKHQYIDRDRLPRTHVAFLHHDRIPDRPDARAPQVTAALAGSS